MRAGRAVTILVAALLALPLALAKEPEGPTTARDECADLQHMPGIGDVCPRGSGLYEVYARDGSSLGFTHGGDALCEGCVEPLRPAASTSAPSCVAGAAGTYYIHVIYARATDDADRYATMAPVIRDLVHSANAMVDDAAIATGDRVALRVLCASGVVVVENAVLPTARLAAGFDSIVADLKALGYNDPRQKYWVYYDDAGACACAGAGHIYDDDSDSIDNWNNGRSGAVPMFAVTFDVVSTRVWLHELGHNLGAVQDSAPRSTLAGHCIDGRDTMCYNDGGPRGAMYSTSSCAVEVFDCGNNDYCHATPAPGSYLDTHWQACHRQSRYLQWADNVAPVMTALSCSPEPVQAETTLTCSFSASDANAGVYYTVSWGDGTTSRAPATGTVAPGTTAQATHSYASAGDRTVSVVATDSGTPALSSAPAEVAVTVTPGNAPPVVAPIQCAPADPQEDALVSCEFVASDAEEHAVWYSLSWGDGSPAERVPASGTVSPGVAQSRSHTYARGGSFAVNVTATDAGTPSKTSAVGQLVLSVADVNDAPVATSLTCPSLQEAGGNVRCTFQATDADSSGVRFLVDWGDGTTTTVPASGHVAPGSTVREATHVYAHPGDRTVTLTVTDNGSPAATSAPLTRVVRIVEDATPPALSLAEPRNGILYEGCARQVDKGTGRPAFLRLGCVKALASDASGIARVEVFHAGRLVAVDDAAPYEVEVPVPPAELSGRWSVRAIDGRGLARVVEFNAESLAGTSA